MSQTMMSAESVVSHSTDVVQTVMSLETTVLFSLASVIMFFICIMKTELLLMTGIVLRSGSIHRIRELSVPWIDSLGVDPREKISNL